MINKTVLIIEDDEDDCEMITEGLLTESPDINLKCFSNPVGALAFLQTSKQVPVLIVSDINMPLMNGIDFKKKIDRDAKFRKIPFVFLTTSVNADVVDKATAGLNIPDYFLKPSSTQAFKETVKSILQIIKNRS